MKLAAAFEGRVPYPLQTLDSRFAPFQCQICGKTFKNRKYLNQHHKIHTGESRRACPVCGKVFASPGGLFSHKKNVHAEEQTEERHGTLDSKSEDRDSE